MIWWLIGGGVLAAMLAASQRKAEIVDKLVAVITFKPGYSVTETAMYDISRAVPAARVTTCPGLPPIGEVLELEAGRTADGKSQTVRAVYKATYAHERTGPIRTEVASCLFKYLKSVNGNVLGLYAARPEAGT